MTNCLGKCFESHPDYTYYTQLCLANFTSFSQNCTEIKARLLAFLDNTCKNECEIPCKISVYNVDLSYLNYPSKAETEALKTNPLIMTKYPGNVSLITRHILSDRMLRVRLHLKTLEIAITEISPQSQFADLISTVGGTLGCFLGASLLSLVDLSEFAIRIVYLILKEVARVLFSSEKRKIMTTTRVEP